MLTFKREGKPGILLFMNPSSSESRVNMTLKISIDQGGSWKNSLLLHPGPSAYSDMVQLNSREVLLLMETGNESPYEGITVSRPLDIISISEKSED